MLVVVGFAVSLDVGVPHNIENMMMSMQYLFNVISGTIRTCSGLMRNKHRWLRFFSDAVRTLAANQFGNFRRQIVNKKCCLVSDHDESILLDESHGRQYWASGASYQSAPLCARDVTLITFGHLLHDHAASLVSPSKQLITFAIYPTNNFASRSNELRKRLFNIFRHQHLSATSRSSDTEALKTSIPLPI